MISFNILRACFDFLESADGYDNVTALSTNVALEQANWYYTSPAFVGSAAAREQVGGLMTSVFLGDATIDEAFKSAVKSLKEQ